MDSHHYTDGFSSFHRWISSEMRCKGTTSIFVLQVFFQGDIKVGNENVFRYKSWGEAV